jgi:hypothetical protein
MKHIPANLPFGVNEFALPPLTKNPHSKILISGVFSVLLIGGVISKFNKIETGSEISTERESVATKIARTLGIHKKSENTAGKITESEYQITLPLEVRANLVEKTRKVVFPGLTFEAPNPDSQGIYSQLKISELTAEHLASLVTYSASSKTKNQYGGFSLLFLVGAQSESLTHPDIYLDQKVVVTLPNSEIQTANSNTGIQILTMDDVIPPNIQHLES